MFRVPVVKGKALMGVVARRDIVFGYMRATAMTGHNTELIANGK